MLTRSVVDRMVHKDKIHTASVLMVEGYFLNTAFSQIQLSFHIQQLGAVIQLICFSAMHVPVWMTTSAMVVQVHEGTVHVIQVVQV